MTGACKNHLQHAFAWRRIRIPGRIRGLFFAESSHSGHMHQPRVIGQIQVMLCDPDGSSAARTRRHGALRIVVEIDREVAVAASGALDERTRAIVKNSKEYESTQGKETKKMDP